MLKATNQPTPLYNGPRKYLSEVRNITSEVLTAYKQYTFDAPIMRKECTERRSHHTGWVGRVFSCNAKAFKLEQLGG